MRENWDFDVKEIVFPTLPKGVTAEYNFAECFTYNDGVAYPDILSKKKTLSVKAHYTQVIWITFRIDKTATKGEYSLPVTIKYFCRGADAETTANFNLKIYSSVLPDVKDQRLEHEYFYYPTAYFKYEDQPIIGDVPDDFYKYQRYSQEWWDYFAETIKCAKDIRMNIFYVTALRYLADAKSKKVASDKWEFNFEIFDKVVEFALSKGVFKGISLEATMTGAQNTTIESLDENSNIVKIEYDTPESNAWAKEFYTAIYNHIKEKGWLDIFYAHLQDEPHQKETWLWARALAKKYMPDVKCGEPIDMIDVAKELTDECSLYIPRTDEYTKDPKFFKARQKKGDKVWVYTCCFPEEAWKLNKFIDLPHSYSRLLHWASFSEGVTGFLHWGFTCWYVSPLYGLVPHARFKGDGFIIYPDVENNSCKMSVRAVATRDGIQEYELLSMLAEKDKKLALKISKSVAKNFDEFNHDENSIDIARAKILNALEN
jgi:hypothetical protein